MTSAEIREKFLSYFELKGHSRVHSAPLIPGNDPTLLFTNAGMVPFKDVFLGHEKRDYSRAASCQRCVRAGGKHNDLENVGYTARHHTFFEMLGNFSFGNYFKRDAIHYAWDFLTVELKLPKEKLFVTVFEDDDEAANIWLKEIGVGEHQFARIGAKDNFWQMGDTGPCGPCTEIFYDHGAHVWGGPPGTPEEDGDRFIEIWNLVFMQYNRDASGTLHPLPKPSVDTGMGLERLAAVMQGVHANYEIDTFVHLIEAAAYATGTQDMESASLKVIADHIRSCAFMIADGVLPSNEGRGYVLRRIIRRALRHGHKLGQDGLFFSSLVAPLVQVMGEAYPELTQEQHQIVKVLMLEEERFAETLSSGMMILQDALKSVQNNTLSGEVVFKLYDTYGFPADLTADVCREYEINIDEAGFDVLMDAQRERARASGGFAATMDVKVDTQTIFTGYEEVAGNGRVEAIFVEGEPVDTVFEGVDAIVVLNETPFYAESGGQVGDIGQITAASGMFEVSDTQKQAKTFLHIGRLVTGKLSVGDSVSMQVQSRRREEIKANHSATHLLHAALRNVLGEHVVQKGSLVTADSLRFDFSHFEPMTSEQMKQVEAQVNAQIRMNHLVHTALMNVDEAKEKGAMALFGEKYDDDVRVVTMGEYSMELCGGIHVKRLGDIGLMRITTESGVAAGVRRIEATTANKAFKDFVAAQQTLSDIATRLKSSPHQVEERIAQLLDKQRQLEKELTALKSKAAASQGGELASQAVEKDGIKVLVAKLEGADAKTLRETVDQLKNKLGTAAIVLAAVEGDKVLLTAGVTADAAHRIHAGKLVSHVAQQVGGKGGGRPDMAQAGGSQPENLEAALNSVLGFI